MNTLILKFRSVMLNFQSESLPVVEGYILSKNDKEQKTLILEKIKEKVWKTRWIDNTQYTVKEISNPISNICSIN